MESVYINRTESLDASKQQKPVSAKGSHRHVFRGVSCMVIATETSWSLWLPEGLLACLFSIFTATLHTCRAVVSLSSLTFQTFHDFPYKYFPDTDAKADNFNRQHLRRFFCRRMLQG